MHRCLGLGWVLHCLKLLPSGLCGSVEAFKQGAAWPSPLISHQAWAWWSLRLECTAESCDLLQLFKLPTEHGEGA